MPLSQSFIEYQNNLVGSLDHARIFITAVTETEFETQRKRLFRSVTEDSAREEARSEAIAMALLAKKIFEKAKNNLTREHQKKLATSLETAFDTIQQGSVEQLQRILNIARNVIRACLPPICQQKLDDMFEEVKTKNATFEEFLEVTDAISQVEGLQSTRFLGKIEELRNELSVTRSLDKGSNFLQEDEDPTNEFQVEGQIEIPETDEYAAHDEGYEQDFEDAVPLHEEPFEEKSDIPPGFPHHTPSSVGAFDLPPREISGSGSGASFIENRDPPVSLSFTTHGMPRHDVTEDDHDVSAQTFSMRRASVDYVDPPLPPTSPTPEAPVGTATFEGSGRVRVDIMQAMRTVCDFGGKASNYRIKHDGYDYKLCTKNADEDSFSREVGTLNFISPPAEPVAPGTFQPLMTSEFVVTKNNMGYYHAQLPKFAAALEISEMEGDPGVLSEFKLALPKLSNETHARDVFLAYFDVFIKPNAEKVLDPFVRENSLDIFANSIRLDLNEKAEKQFAKFFAQDDRKFMASLPKSWLAQNNVRQDDLLANLKIARHAFKVHLNLKPALDAKNKRRRGRIFPSSSGI